MNDKIQEAFEFIAQAEDLVSGLHQRKFREALNTIEAALAQQGEQEPVKWCREQGHRNYYLKTGEQCSCRDKFAAKPALYTHPQPAAIPESAFKEITENAVFGRWSATRVLHEVKKLLAVAPKENNHE